MTIKLASDEDRPPTETFLLAADREDQQIVSVHIKRTYKLEDDGRCVPAELQMPLLMRPLPAPEGKEPFYETDVIPFKASTDLIVMASVHGRGRSQVTAGIRLGQLDLKYRVSGPRRCSYRGRGSFAFSDPEPFETQELRYEHAYGGVDETVPDPPVEHLEDFMRWHPGAYPRNPVGRGFVVFDNKEAIEGLELPAIEHPKQLLTPETLVAGGINHWWRQPLPWSCDWFDKIWYPRIVHYRGIPDGIPQDDRVMPEVQMGWLDPGHSTTVPQQKLTDLPDNRLADAASPALVLPYLQGDEAIALTEMTPNGRIVVQLPKERPRIRLRHAGRMHDVEPTVHRVLISTDEMGVYVVWHGAWRTPHRLPRGLPGRDDPASLGLEGIDVLVDDRPIEPLDKEPPPIAEPPGQDGDDGSEKA